MFFIIYKTTNMITNEYYIGKHYTENLNDGYLGSGSKFLEDVKKYGKENFFRNILQFCKSYDEMNEAESKWINENVMNDPMCLNLKTGGEYNVEISDELRKKYSKGNLGRKHTEETKKKISETHLGKHWHQSESVKQKISESHKGKHPTEETRKKMSEARMGKRISEETKKKIGEANKKRWELRERKLSDEHKKRISEGLKKAYTEGKRKTKEE